jgi:hypothetical protein
MSKGAAPWFPASWPGWRFPDANHPATQDFPYWAEGRRSACNLCGAPAGARCVTRRGGPTSNHGGRGLQRPTRA